MSMQERTKKSWTATRWCWKVTWSLSHKAHPYHTHTHTSPYTNLWNTTSIGYSVVGFGGLHPATPEQTTQVWLPCAPEFCACVRVVTKPATRIQSDTALAEWAGVMQVRQGADL